MSPCPELRAGFRRALSLRNVDASGASGESCLPEHEQSEGSHSRRQFLPKLLLWSVVYLLALLLGYGRLYGGFDANGWQFAGAPADSDDQGPWVPLKGPIVVPDTSPFPATSPVPATSLVPAAPATSSVPATCPVPLTSVGMSSSSAGLIDPSLTSAMAQPIAASAMAQPMAPPLAVPQIKYAARPGEGRLPINYASALRLVALSGCRVWTGTLCCERSRAIIKLIDGAGRVCSAE